MNSRALVSNKQLKRKPPKRLSNVKKDRKRLERETIVPLQAQLKFKKSAKGLELFLREFSENLTKKIEPLELIAMIGLTYMVKTTIDKSEELLGVIRRDFTPIWEEEFAPHWKKGFLGIPQLTIWKEKAIVPVELLPDLHEWIISFAIAYIIIRHGGQILGLLGGGLTSIIKLFLVRPT